MSGMSAFNADLHADIENLTAKEILKEFGRPECDLGFARLHNLLHRGYQPSPQEEQNTGTLDPVSDYAKKCDRVDLNVLRLIRDLRPQLYFIENPRGGMRKMDWIQIIPRHTVTYCRYGDTRMKPTDIFTNARDPQFKPPCKNGDPCHIAAPRGAKTGTQGIKGHVDRSRIPYELCSHIVDICEREVEATNED